MQHKCEQFIHMPLILSCLMLKLLFWPVYSYAQYTTSQEMPVHNPYSPYSPYNPHNRYDSYRPNNQNIGPTANAPNIKENNMGEDTLSEDSEGFETKDSWQQNNYTAIKLRGLDKVTAKREQFTAIMGAVTRFGNLEIIPRACWQAPPSQRPETAALLEIWYWKPGEQPERIFYGWMFASSSALSSIEHPVYDISVLECLQETAEQIGEPVNSKNDGQ